MQQRADALFVSADPFLSSRREQLVARAARHGIPTLHEIREFVEAGGLISYGTVLREGYYKGGIYAARILKGADPADLPVEQVNRLELLINLKTARTLGLQVPDKLLALAESVTEIGLGVGFSETSSFTSAFRKVTGETQPSTAGASHNQRLIRTVTGNTERPMSKQANT